MNTRVLLIRHGITDWGQEAKYCGISDIDLNEKGEQQARYLSQRLKKLNIHRVYCSDVKRALNFAKLTFNGISIIKRSEFCEMNFGIFEGLTYQEILSRYKDIYDKWLNDPVDVTIPQGENLRNLEKRVCNTFFKILKQNNNKTIAIVTHAGPIKVILNKILNLDLKNTLSIRQDFACINIIQFTKQKIKILSLNDTSHLING